MVKIPMFSEMFACTFFPNSSPMVFMPPFKLTAGDYTVRNFVGVIEDGRRLKSPRSDCWSIAGPFGFRYIYIYLRLYKQIYIYIWIYTDDIQNICEKNT